MARRGRRAKNTAQSTAEAYKHSEKEALLRPDVGLQAQFKQKRPSKTYQYDPSLDPQLVWAGKAERAEFSVPTLPLFVHERLSTQAILQTLKGRKHDKQQNLFADVELDLTDRILQAYVHKAPWVNRLILGDSLVVMNSLLQYESLGGQVQMIYMDPPYGVRFSSNFQPFVRKRDVKHGDDADLTREPEMVQAYRDTWELGLHSYLTYLGDRLLLCRELLHPSGSIFVQISDENVHHVREILDEIFRPENFVVSIFLRKKGSQRGGEIKPINDYVLWYAKDKTLMRRRFLYDAKMDAMDLSDEFEYIELPNGETRRIQNEDLPRLDRMIQEGARLYVAEPLTSGGEHRTQLYTVKIGHKVYRPPANNCWKFSETGMNRLVALKRIHEGKNQIRFKKYHTDFPFVALSNLWSDLAGASDKVYVVQTASKAIARCLLMTTDPGDIVLDPTCGSGTTAYVAEQWGRRWITIDTSRVPLVLARQRLLTATFPYYELREADKGPAGGFVYRNETQTKNPRSIGPGLVTHITSTAVANEELPQEAVLVDRPEVVSGITRVSGPFVVEATIPTPVEVEPLQTVREPEAEYSTDPIARMIVILKRSPILRLPNNQTVTFKNIRRPARAMDLHAEGVVANSTEKPVAFVFGPEHGAVTEAMVLRAAKEANAKNFTHLYVIGFAIQAGASKFIQNCEKVADIPATYVQATMDMQMGDLLKTTRASQVFSVTGAPEVRLARLKQKKGDDPLYQVELLGLDVFDPVTMEVDHEHGENVPAWFLDTDYNELAFCVSQAFFPRTSAWDNLKRALKGVYDDSVWDHLAGTVSEPFAAGEHQRIAVKVIDDRGNELMVVKSLADAEKH